MDDLEAVLDDPHGHELFAVVPAVHHERVDQSLDNGAVRLAEPLGRVTASRVRQVLGVLVLHGDVVLKKPQIKCHSYLTFLNMKVYEDDQSCG